MFIKTITNQDFRMFAVKKDTDLMLKEVKIDKNDIHGDIALI